MCAGRWHRGAWGLKCIICVFVCIRHCVVSLIHSNPRGENAGQDFPTNLLTFAKESCHKTLSASRFYTSLSVDERSLGFPLPFFVCGRREQIKIRLIIQVSHQITTDRPCTHGWLSEPSTLHLQQKNKHEREGLRLAVPYVMSIPGKWPDLTLMCFRVLWGGFSIMLMYKEACIFVCGSCFNSVFH